MKTKYYCDDCNIELQKVTIDIEERNAVITDHILICSHCKRPYDYLERGCELCSNVEYTADDNSQCQIFGCSVSLYGQCQFFNKTVHLYRRF